MHLVEMNENAHTLHAGASADHEARYTHMKSWVHLNICNTSEVTAHVLQAHWSMCGLCLRCDAANWIVWSLVRRPAAIDTAFLNGPA